MQMEVPGTHTEQHITGGHVKLPLPRASLGHSPLCELLQAGRGARGHVFPRQQACFSRHKGPAHRGREALRTAENHPCPKHSLLLTVMCASSGHFLAVKGSTQTARPGRHGRLKGGPSSSLPWAWWAAGTPPSTQTPSLQTGDKEAGGHSHQCPHQKRNREAAWLGTQHPHLPDPTCAHGQLC